MTTTVEARRILPYGRQQDLVAAADLPTTCPPPSGRWHPFSHATFYTLVTRLLANRSCTVTHEEHYLSSEGACYLGALTLSSTTLSSLAGLPATFDLILRNSINKSIAAHLAAGARLSMCSNGVIFGATLSTRRVHTLPANADLELTLSARLLPFLDAIPAEHAALSTRLSALRSTPLASPSDTVIAAARQDIIASCDILPVLDYFEHPETMTDRGTPLTSPEASTAYVPGSSFCMFNAFTARLRDKVSPLSLPARSSRLLSLFSV